MILRALTLENFKGIREPVRIVFAPLTLLFGPNNAGKSTIVQALMLSEVLERNNCDPGRTELGGDVIDLGGFENLVYGHDRTRVIRMRFELNLRGKGNGLPEYSDWVRQAELESHVSYFFDNAPKELDIRSIDEAPARLVDVWIEIQVAWSDAQQRPVLCAYSVGTGSERYATISYDDARAEATLSYFNFGVYPFGTRYKQGDASDFEWAFERVSRAAVRRLVEHGKIADIEKGSRIQMFEDEDATETNRLSRRRFDALVSDILNGTGQFAPCTTEEQDDVQKALLGWRRKMMKQAEACVAVWSFPPEPSDLKIPNINLGSASSSIQRDSSLAPDVGALASDDPDNTATILASQPASETNEPANFEGQMRSQGPDDDHERDDVWEDRMEALSSPLYRQEEEIESWLLELFVALIRDGYVPTSTDTELPLTLRDSALPEWKRKIAIDSRAWMPDKWNEFWEYPAFVQEYLEDLLTCVITGPGERLLGVLQNAIYLSPFRTTPPRHYQPARSSAPNRWANGLAAWDWMLLKGKPFARLVNGWLTPEDRFNAGYAVDLRHYHELELDHPLLALADGESSAELSWEWLRGQLRELPQGRRVQIKDLRTNISTFPQDLGAGISQVIPVIVAALHNTKGVVAIEEPESNIHPAFQVVLADLFITQANANPDVLFLVETHSEHLMLRCLRRIRETTEGQRAEGELRLVPADIAVHFVEASEAGPRIHRIRIAKDGEFMDRWPRGFFRERMKEIYGDDL